MGPSTCIVIGGGPAGLLSAARLAQAGVRTTLLEARAGLGGRAASAPYGSWAVNQGPHALYVGGAAMRELRALGLDPPRWNPASPTGSLMITTGRAHRGPGGRRTAAALGGWMARLARGPAASELAERSTADWLDEELAEPSARAIAQGLVRVVTFTADHAALSAEVAVAQLRLGAWPGVRYVRGGWQRLVDGLAEQAGRHGADVRTRSAVRALERDEDRWSVHTDDGALPADAVIVATGLPEAARKLLGAAGPAPGPAAEVSALDVALTRLPCPRRHFAFGTDAPTYLSKHSPPGRRGEVLLTAAGYGTLPHEGLEAVIDAVQPGWRDRLSLAPRHLPRMTAVSAIATSAGGGLAGRPAAAVDGVDGVFVAGDWVGPEGWLLDAALASGAAAARGVLATVGAGART